MTLPPCICDARAALRPRKKCRRNQHQASLIEKNIVLKVSPRPISKPRWPQHRARCLLVQVNSPAPYSQLPRLLLQGRLGDCTGRSTRRGVGALYKMLIASQFPLPETKDLLSLTFPQPFPSTVPGDRTYQCPGGGLNTGRTLWSTATLACLVLPFSQVRLLCPRCNNATR